MSRITDQRAILLPASDQPGYDELPDTLAERRALPARFHTPVWDDTCTPKTWFCAVCWDEDSCSAWPCETASKQGGQVFAPEHIASAAIGGEFRARL